MKPAISICDYHSVGSHAHLPITHIVSIGNDCPDLRPFCGKEFTMYRFVFDDISGPCPTGPSHSMMRDMIGTFQAIRFLQVLAEPEPSTHVLFHCAAGISRSPAAAFVFLVVLGWSYKDAYAELLRVRGIVQPNLYMIKLADKLLSKNGEMVSFVAHASGHADWLTQPHHQETLNPTTPP
jgi:predicted protein tyrosine phosphatase